MSAGALAPADKMADFTDIFAAGGVIVAGGAGARLGVGVGNAGGVVGGDGFGLSAMITFSGGGVSSSGGVAGSGVALLKAGVNFKTVGALVGAVVFVGVGVAGGVGVTGGVVDCAG